VIPDRCAHSPQRSAANVRILELRSLLLLVGRGHCLSAVDRLRVERRPPVHDFTKAVSSGTINFNDNTRRYIFGPTFEVRLPFGLAIEVDALYRRFNYNQFIGGVAGTTSVSTSGNAWEFPLLAKYRFKAPVARPFIAGGMLGHPLGLSRTYRTPSPRPA
jgi:hypothetical protein